jgi:cell division protein FtsB
MVEDRLSKATRACEKAASENAALSAQMDVLKSQLETAKKDVVEARAKVRTHRIPGLAVTVSRDAGALFRS